MKDIKDIKGSDEGQKNRNKKIIHMDIIKRLATDDKMDEFIREQLKQEADEYEKKLNDNRGLDDIEVPEDMFDNIVGKLKKKGIWVEDPVPVEETDDKAYALLSEVDRKALEIGRRQMKRTWRQKLTKIAGTAAILVIGVFVMSMTSGANRKYMMGLWNSVVGNELQVQVSNDGEEIQEDNLVEGERAAHIDIQNTLGIKVPLFVYKPMRFLSYEINSEMGDCNLKYQYGESILTIYMMPSNSNFKIGVKFDGEIAEEVSSRFQEEDILIYAIDDENYSTSFKYKDTYYSVSGKIALNEFEKIVQNIYF